MFSAAVDNFQRDAFDTTLCGAAPTKFGIVDRSACGSPTRIFEVGSRIAGASLYRREGSGSCSPAAASPVNLPVVSIGAELPADSFVAATEVER